MDSVYNAIFVQTWPWYVGGPAIGLFVLAFLVFQNKLLSASSTFQAVIEAAQGKGNADTDIFAMKTEVGDLPVDPSEKAPRWRVWFFVGLALGGFASAMMMGSWGATPALQGMGEFYGVGSLGQIALLALGGAFIGFGTRFCGGCTSGHAIVGISGRQWPSMVATAIFFGTGMLTTFIIHWMRG